MSSRAFFTEAAKTKIGEVVRAIESDTRAELVVAVRPRMTGLESWEYGASAAVSYLGLLAFLYLPIEFSLWVAAVGVPGLFVGALALLRLVDGLRLAVVPATKRCAQAEVLASASFQRLGVANTKERNGILVHVSPHERTVVVLADRGLDDILGDTERETLERCLAGGANVVALTTALEGLGKHLAERQPRGSKRENELEDVA